MPPIISPDISGELGTSQNFTAGDKVVADKSPSPTATAHLRSSDPPLYLFLSCFSQRCNRCLSTYPGSYSVSACV